MAILEDSSVAKARPGFPPVQEADQVVEQALSDYGTYVNESMSRLYRFMGFTTLEWTARGAIITDIHGQDFIDCGSYGVFFHGHNHPKVVAAVREQLDRMALSGRTLPHKPVADLARKLAEATPGGLQYTFFCNSGAEAVEGALKLARAFKKKPGIISTEGAFHGKTFGALSASGRELYRKPFYPLLPGFTHVPYGDAEAIAKAVNDDTAAVILEPIQGENGVVVPPDDYLPRVRQICDEKGVLLILDEVQTGMGRTGKLWAFEHWGVVPDILTTAKALGGGVMPIGAFMSTPEIFSVFDENPYIHSSTFGGNQMACAAGVAALDVIQEEGLLEQAARKGKRLLTALTSLAKDYPDVIREVRGKGLLIGLEMVSEGASGLMISELIDRKVIVIHSLNNPRVIRISPPAVITEAQIDHVLEAVAAGVARAHELAGDLG
ncbi:MAG: aminotransferase class III-fold pyridoxal phosphate-dependent enzyme [Firmicutes bacterium]|nr:aminotransferase class III-fold pyridoxal phosphate-dependent enzyme [Bacillota bacterium]